jgi:hypothetical protein
MVTGALKVPAQVSTTTWLNMSETDLGQPFSNIPKNLLVPDNCSRKSPSGLPKQLCGNNTNIFWQLTASAFLQAEALNLLYLTLFHITE